MPSNAKIGALLVREGSVTAAEIRSALRSQERTGRRLGDVLVERGVVSRSELARVLSGQQGLGLDQGPGFGTGLRAALERARQEKSSALIAS
jgi:hypothetical protein